MMSKRVAKTLQLFQLRLGFGERRFGHRDDAATGFPALAAQTHDPPDFIETEAERLRFAYEAHLVQRGIVVDAVSARRSRRLREEPAPLVEADGAGSHYRKPCQPTNQQRLFIHRVSNAACSRVIRPS